MHNTDNTQSTYQQHSLSPAEKRGKLKLIISEDGQDNSLKIHQDIRIYSGLFDKGEEANFHIPSDRYVYINLARGRLKN